MYVCEGDESLQRMPLRESQLTVPETPSPDAAAARKGVLSCSDKIARYLTNPVLGWLAIWVAMMDIGTDRATQLTEYAPHRCAGRRTQAAYGCSDGYGPRQAKLHRRVCTGGQALWPHPGDGGFPAGADDAEGASGRPDVVISLPTQLPSTCYTPAVLSHPLLTC